MLLKDQAMRPPCKLKSRVTDTVVKLSNIPGLLKVLIVCDGVFVSLNSASEVIPFPNCRSKADTELHKT